MWRLLKQPAVMRLYVEWQELMSSAAYGAAHYAVRKTDIDISLKEIKGEAKRKEAMEWMNHYCREHGIVVPSHIKTLLLEMAVHARR